jgi:hypothetical protein
MVIAGRAGKYRNMGIDHALAHRPQDRRVGVTIAWRSPSHKQQP